MTGSRRAGAGFPALVRSIGELGRRRGGSKSVKVLIIDDWFVELTEQFKVSLAALQGGQPGNLQETRVDILDNDKSWWPFGRH